jgi:imidazoleglycerol phosphate dehydratase HisB
MCSPLNAITIIGLPFAVAHLKLAGAALTPFGNQVVPLDEAVARGHEVRVLVDRSGRDYIDHCMRISAVSGGKREFP